MRRLGSLLALLGLIGVVVGVVWIVRHAATPGVQDFAFENYGGPGAIVASIMLVCAGLFIRSVDDQEG
jgi:hypothetical protein